MQQTAKKLEEIPYVTELPEYKALAEKELNLKRQISLIDEQIKQLELERVGADEKLLEETVRRGDLDEVSHIRDYSGEICAKDHKRGLAVNALSVIREQKENLIREKSKAILAELDEIYNQLTSECIEQAKELIGCLQVLDVFRREAAAHLGGEKPAGRWNETYPERRYMGGKYVDGSLAEFIERLAPKPDKQTIEAAEEPGDDEDEEDSDDELPEIDIAQVGSSV